MHHVKVDVKARETHRFFDRRWEEIEMVVPYNKNWERPIRRKIMEVASRDQDIDYCLTGIHEDNSLEVIPTGGIAKAIDDNGRKVIIVATRLGRVVMYCCSKDLRGDKLTTSFDQRITNAGLRPHLWSLEEHAAIIGSPNGIHKSRDIVYRNMGQWMERTYSALSRPMGHIDDVRIVFRGRQHAAISHVHSVFVE